ncbi:hypothetical protein [Clostridium carboxidivorans]|uniref:hypothetical protein n=1 Tax=Clostridium carboxidivorans TaxID=217159 RepID=UPI0018DC1CB2|nr:hypothetical protein [Clostridium carboxidivorans]
MRLVFPPSSADEVVAAGLLPHADKLRASTPTSIVESNFFILVPPKFKYLVYFNSTTCVRLPECNYLPSDNQILRNFYAKKY